MSCLKILITGSNGVDIRFLEFEDFVTLSRMFESSDESWLKSDPERVFGDIYLSFVVESVKHLSVL